MGRLSHAHRALTTGVLGGGGLSPAQQLNNALSGLTVYARYDATLPTTLWQDASRTTPATLSGNVRCWDDISGNNRHLNVFSGTGNITRVSDQVDFTTARLGLASVADVRPVTIFAVAEQIGTASITQGLIMLSAGGTVNTGYQIFMQTGPEYAFREKASTASYGADFRDDGPIVFSARDDGTNNKLYINGVERGTAATGTADTISNIMLGDIGIGYWWRGNMREVIVVGETVALDTHANIIELLAQKHSVNFS